MPTKKASTAKSSKSSKKSSSKKSSSKKSDASSARGRGSFSVQGNQLSAAASILSAASIRKLNQTIDMAALSQSVGRAVSRAVSAQGSGLSGGIIICGIVYDVKSKSFKPILQNQQQF